ncbi:hypothetical protein C8E86_3025 [Catellatospora citrea]|nr:hypothetical protein C8E86_3025 [Catellatospora citrea]
MHRKSGWLYEPEGRDPHILGSAGLYEKTDNAGWEVRVYTPGNPSHRETHDFDTEDKARKAFEAVLTQGRAIGRWKLSEGGGYSRSYQWE